MGKLVGMHMYTGEQIDNSYSLCRRYPGSADSSVLTCSQMCSGHCRDNAQQCLATCPAACLIFFLPFLCFSFGCFIEPLMSSRISSFPSSGARYILPSLFFPTTFLAGHSPSSDPQPLAQNLCVFPCGEDCARRSHQSPSCLNLHPENQGGEPYHQRHG